MSIIHTLGGKQDLKAISVFRLYKIIILSSKPESGGEPERHAGICMVLKNLRCRCGRIG